MAQGGGSVTRRRMMMPLQQDSIDPDQPYPMNLPRLGHAVIVNNIASEMPGSLRDVEALKSAYKTIGFDVQVHNDCSAQEMRRINKWIMNDDHHTDSNCFALTIISHGNDKGHLFDKSRKKAWDTELFVADLSDVESLVGKPKIIVIQACRGLQWTEGKAAPGHTLPDEDDRETTHILPDKADMFLAYATVPGYRADAGTQDGSIYLQALAKYLQQEYMRRPLDKILKMVRQHMIRKVQGTSGMKQCPEDRNSLIYDVMISLLQGTSGMKQCPEERNSLIFDVMFSEFHQKGVSAAQILSQKQQKEIEEAKKKLEKEKEEFRRKEAAMATKMRQNEEERKVMEAEMSDRIKELEAKMKEMKTSQTQVAKKEFKKKESAKATKIRQTEEEGRTMETKVTDRIQELEAKIKEMNEPAQTQEVGDSTDTEHFKIQDAAREEAQNEAIELYDAGSYDKALVKAERALGIEEKELGARDEQMVELYRLLADIWTQKFSTGGYEGNEHLDILHKAMNLSEKAITIYRRLPQNKTNKKSFAWLLKEYVYALIAWRQSGGDDRLSAEDALDKAKSTIEEIITIAQQTNDMKLLADVNMKKGNIHQCEEEAVKWFSEALRITKEHFGENDELCGVIYYNTGIHHQKRVELEEAYENFKQSYLSHKEVKGDKHPFTEGALRQLREDRYVKIAKQRGEKW